MARARSIKPGFFKNEKLAELGPEAMLLFAGLWTIADRSGRLEDRPKRIRAEVLPYSRRVNVEKLLAELESRNFIVRYVIGTEHYIAIPTWGKHQNPHIREAVSEIPPPPEHSASTVLGTSPALPFPERAGLTPSSLTPSSLTPSKDPLPPEGGFAETRPPRKNRKAHRTTDEIRAALGSRLPWWDAFWKEYPCHEGVNLAMDTYERTVTTRETAEDAYRGAKRYATKIRLEPDAKVKYAQGWLSAERWKDEIRTVAPMPSVKSRDMLSTVSGMIQESLAKGEEPW